ncbi:hypothetical protein [Pseudoalteromonas sp. S1610]|uniref:hypothetical protein n=1 Tax=Pseudoalteromonas sp. S1610 TaxID=579506 RepID=UPI00201DAA7F|nr:hypothetical protein [Pseudoalteromonas sp. S1610]
MPLSKALNLIQHSAIYALYPHRYLPVRTRLYFDAVREYIGKEKPIWDHSIREFDQMF